MVSTPTVEYDFNRSDSGNVTNTGSGGTTYNLTNNGARSRELGNSEKYRYFLNGDDYLQDGAYALGNTFSIEVIYYAPVSDNWYPIITCRNEAGGGWYVGQYQGTAYCGNVSGGTDVQVVTTSPVPPNRATHLIYTHTSSTNGAKIYVNGALNNTGTVATTTNAGNLTIGSHSDLDQLLTFYGSIFLIRIYDVALSSADVTTLYNAETGRYTITDAPTVCFNTGTILYPWLDENTYAPIPEVLNYMAANGVEVKDSLNPTSLTDTQEAAALIQWWRDIYRDYGIKVWCHCENQMEYGVNHDGSPGDVAGWVYADYETNYGDCMDLFEAEGAYMVGFSYENGNDIGAQWIRDRAQAAGKKVSAMFWTSATFGDPVYDNLSFRMSLLDEIIVEVWCTGMLTDTMLIRDAINVLDPFFNQGVLTRFGPNWGADTSTPWKDNLEDPPALSWEQQHITASLYLPDYKPAGRSFDVIESYAGYLSSCGHSVIEQIDYLMVLAGEWTETTVPNTAVAVRAPSVATASNRAETTVPNVAVAPRAPVVSTSVTETRVPNVAAALHAPAVAISSNIAETTVPNTTVAPHAPAIATSSNIALTTVPNITVNPHATAVAPICTAVTRWVTEPELLALTPVETNSAVVYVTSAETVTLVTVEAMQRAAISAETVTLLISETSRASYASLETVTLKNVETRTAITYVDSAEIVTLKIAELSQSRLPTNVITLASDETIYLDITETSGLAVPTSNAETILLKTTEHSDPNFVYAPPSWVKAHPVDYTLEVRMLNTDTGGWDFLGVLDQRIAPSIQREVGLADVLSFNLLLSDPKTSLFMGSLKGLEIWYYGRDALLKQVFKVQKVEIYRDYGGSGGGSGGSTLGSGSGDGMLIVADGPESYLSEKYILYDYRAVQKRPYEILKNILDGIWGAGIGIAENTFADVDSSLNGKLIDMTLSWESCKAAIDSLIQQIGGVLEITIAPDGIRRCIQIVPLPGEVIPTATEGGGAFNVSRRFGELVASPDTLPVLAYTAFPPNGNAIKSNNSSVQIDAHAYMNNFMTLKSGATAWNFKEGRDDRIQAAASTEVADLSSYTIESCVYIGTQTTTGSGYDGARIFSKEQVYGAFEFIYDATYQRLMYVRGTYDENLDAWVTADNSVPENDWYYIQLIRDGTTGPDDELPPNLIVDDIVLDLTQFSVATGTWSSDFPNDLYIGNDSTLAHPFIGKCSLFRIYNYAILDSLSSFLHDGWRRDPTTAQIILDRFPMPGRMIPQGIM
jgi:hypothetical protein